MFYFRLARELGYTVGRLLQEVSSREIAGWMAFLTLEDEQRERKKQKASTAAMSAHLDTLGRAADKKKKAKEKWQRRADSKSSGTVKKS